jgi:pseudouridine 5'-phosphatase
MNEAQPLKAVVFDLDGLIVNTEDLYERVVDQMLADRGKTHDRELRRLMMGRPLIESFRVMVEYHALPDLLEDLETECREIFAEIMGTSLSTMPGFRELAAELEAAKIPVAIGTSASREYAKHVLTHLDLYERFRFILTVDDVDNGKPAPDIYLLAAKRLGLAPQQTMVLEDSDNGCRSGVAAGAFTVAVPNRHTAEHEFPGARFVADTLADRRIREALGIA